MPRKETKLREIAERLWVVDEKFPLPKGLIPFAIPGFLGQCPIRMSVVKLASGGLWLHSPVSYTPELATQLAMVGPIEIIVGPSVLHHTFIGEWHKQFPKARVEVAPKTAKRAPTLGHHPVLSDDHPVAASDLDQVIIQGHRSYETLFFHRQTKTLIVTDLGYSITPQDDLIYRIFMYARGVRNPLGMTRYNRRTITNKAAFEASLDKVFAWDFDRLIMSHGAIVEKGAKPLYAKLWGRVV